MKKSKKIGGDGTAANSNEATSEYETKITDNEPVKAKSGMRVIAQYIKNFSFDNPNSPSSFQIQESPSIDLNINLSAANIGKMQFEVVLQLSAKATHGEKAMFNSDLSYGGVFEFFGLNEKQIHPLIFIECPRLLFPFVRQIIADTTRNAGFPPLLLNPIDFAEMYWLKTEKDEQQNVENRVLH